MNQHLTTIENYLGKEISEYKYIDAGWDFEVFIAEALVFRFPKNDYAKKRMQRESDILHTINPHIQSIETPSRKVIDNQYMIGKYIEGEPLPHERKSYTPDIVKQITTFLHELHSISYETIYENDSLKSVLQEVMQSGWLREEDKKPKIIRHMLGKIKIEWFIRSIKKNYPTLEKQTLQNITAYLKELFFDFISPQKALVHTDIQGKNILYNEKQEKITGIVDFTNARRSNIERDFCHFYNISEELLEKVIQEYFGQENKQFKERVIFLSRIYILRELTNSNTLTNEYIQKQLTRYNFM